MEDEEEEEEETTSIEPEDLDNPMAPLTSQSIVVGSTATQPVTDVTTASARAKALAEIKARSTDVKQLPTSVRQKVVSTAAVAPPAWLGQSVVPGLSSIGYIDPATGNSVDEYDINEYPQYARFKITHKVSDTKILLSSVILCITGYSSSTS